MRRADWRAFGFMCPNWAYAHGAAALDAALARPQVVAKSQKQDWTSVRRCCVVVVRGVPCRFPHEVFRYAAGRCFRGV